MNTTRVLLAAGAVLLVSACSNFKLGSNKLKASDRAMQDISQESRPAAMAEKQEGLYASR
jgi:hypothetical protein